MDCRRCGGVKTERLEFLLENALHTRRFARYIGRRCRGSTIRDVAAEENLDWQTVKRLEKRYMVHQGSEVRPAVASGEPHRIRPLRQELGHRTCAEQSILQKSALLPR